MLSCIFYCEADPQEQLARLMELLILKLDIDELKIICRDLRVPLNTRKWMTNENILLHIDLKPIKDIGGSAD